MVEPVPNPTCGARKKMDWVRKHPQLHYTLLMSEEGKCTLRTNRQIHSKAEGVAHVNVLHHAQEGRARE